MDETQPPSSSSLEYQFVVSSAIQEDKVSETSDNSLHVLVLIGELLDLCLNAPPDSRLSEARSLDSVTLVFEAAVSDAERWLSVRPAAKTAAGTRRPAAAADSAGRPGTGLRNQTCN